MTASVPLDQATDIIQNRITGMSKQKMKLKTTALDSLCTLSCCKFPSCYNKKLELSLKPFMLSSYFFLSPFLLPSFLLSNQILAVFKLMGSMEEC